MDKETIESFSRYRLNRAKETLQTAKMIFKERNIFWSVKMTTPFF